MSPIIELLLFNGGGGADWRDQDPAGRSAGSG